MVKVGIIGAGVVGVATGMGISEVGHKVIYYDISQEKMGLLNSWGLSVVDSIKELISLCDISFVCVNTPTLNGAQDLSQIDSTLVDIAKSIDMLEKYHLLVIRSTILPGTMRKLVNHIEKNCSKKRGSDYDICYNPEFLKEKTSLEDFRKPDRVVLGEDKHNVSLPLKKIYQNFSNNIIVTNFETAEMIKYVSNCFLSLKISFFNEIGLICKHLGIDDMVVSEAVSLDKRIGKYGTSFGKPFGGACLPKDTQAFYSFIKELNLQTDLFQVILDINNKISTMNDKLIEKLPKI